MIRPYIVFVIDVRGGKPVVRYDQHIPTNSKQKHLAGRTDLFLHGEVSVQRVNSLTSQDSGVLEMKRKLAEVA